MSTISVDGLKDIGLTVDLGERLTLIFVFGPGYLARAGLAEVGEAIGGGRQVVQHRLDRRGPNVAQTVAETAGSGESRPIVLVSGLERMAAERREQLLVRMNLLRDTLSKQPAAIVMWIPVEIADDFRRSCVDLFQWRTLTVQVEAPEEDDDARLRHEYLVALASAELAPIVQTPMRRLSVREVGELRVRIEGEDAARGIESWLDRDRVQRGFVLGPAGSGKTTALRRYAARRAEELLDAGTGELPVVVEARRLSPRSFRIQMVARATSPLLTEEVGAWLTQQLAASPAILLVDGVDELAGARYRPLESGFLAFAANNPRVRVVFSSRDASKFIDDWPTAEVQPLEPDAIATCLSEAGHDPARVMEVLASANAEELATTPLSLQILTELASPGADLWALDLTNVIGVVVDTRLQGWDRSRGIQRGVTPISQARGQLCNLAMMLMGGQHEPVQTSVLDFVAARFEILRRSERRSEEGEDVDYRFTLEVFRDYFAGAWLAAHPDSLVDYAIQPKWRFPIFHALNLLASNDFERESDMIWDASAGQPRPARWTMRALVLRAALTRKDDRLRSRVLERAQAALERAQQAADPPELWTPVAELLAQR